MQASINISDSTIKKLDNEKLNKNLMQLGRNLHYEKHWDW